MIDTRVVDPANETEGNDLVDLLDRYAQHPMGGGTPLPQQTRENLAAALARREDSITILAYEGDTAIGLCNCFEAFSTFACQPILNIHDVYVADGYRGQGVAAQMMRHAEFVARERGCCKLTLEVLSENHVAKASYRACGYAPYELDANFGYAEFWQKNLSDPQN
jgi:GNAT superfamily N-acetyltransferase